MLHTLTFLVLLMLNAGEFNVQDYGAIPNDNLDDTVAIQATINAAIPACGHVIIGEGVFDFTPLDFRKIHPVSNGAPFGLKFTGAGMGTVLRFHGASGPAFQFDAGATDLQIHMADFQLQDLSSTPIAVGINVGTMNRYSVFRDIRTYGFRTAILFNRMTQGLTLERVSIRGTGRYAVASTITASNIETSWTGGYIDNCGRDSYYGGQSYPVLYLYRWGASNISRLIMEGNFAGGIFMDACDEVRISSIRSEETLVRFAPVHNVHHISASCTGISIRDSYFAWDGSLGSHWGTIASKVLFNNDRFDDIARTNRYPFNTYGAGQAILEFCRFK